MIGVESKKVIFVNGSGVGVVLCGVVEYNVQCISFGCEFGKDRFVIFVFKVLNVLFEVFNIQ